MNIIQKPAHPNNYTVGRGGKKIDKVIVHWIVGSLASADATFANPDRKASAHYGIENSNVHQWVKETDTAWHAGNWNANQTSIGIEHSGGELQSGGLRRTPSETTHKTSAKLIADICRRHNIPINKDTIVPHNKFSATQCPGTLDINKLIDLALQAQTPEKPPTYNNRQLVTDILIALKGKTTNDEIDAWNKRYENPVSMIQEIIKGDGGYHDLWVKPHIDTAKLEIEAIYQSQIQSANGIIEALRVELKQLREQKTKDWEAIQLIKEGLKKLLGLS